MTAVYMLAPQSSVQMMSFILKSNDHMVVIDGGNNCDADYLFSYVKKLGGVVDGWFFTHPHSDHCNAFNTLMENCPHELEIRGLYYSFLPMECLCDGGDPGAPKSKDCQNAVSSIIRMNAQIKKHGLKVTTLQKGDVFTFGEMTFTVLRVADENMVSDNVINNSSAVLRLDANGKSMIFLGDLGVEGGLQLLDTTSPELLKADMVQVAHHGQKGVGREVYEAIDADYCFWCTPDWLWDNDRGLGYDTHTYKTIVTRGWLSDIGVKRHYVSKDGTHEVRFDDLNLLEYKQKNK